MTSQGHDERRALSVFRMSNFMASAVPQGAVAPCVLKCGGQVPQPTPSPGPGARNFQQKAAPAPSPC